MAWKVDATSIQRGSGIGDGDVVEEVVQAMRTGVQGNVHVSTDSKDLLARKRSMAMDTFADTKTIHRHGMPSTLVPLFGRMSPWSSCSTT